MPTNNETRIEADGGDPAIELALTVARRGVGAGPNIAFVLAHEVDRLREQLEFRERENAIETEAKQKSWEAEAKLREERDLFRAASEAAEQRIVELTKERDAARMVRGAVAYDLGSTEAQLAKVQDKLARVEALRREALDAGQVQVGVENIARALRDEPQPEPQPDQAVAKLRTDDWKLRQDLKTACENAVEFQATSNAVRAKLARVEALSAVWKSRADRLGDAFAFEKGEAAGWTKCAVELETALRDEPQPEPQPVKQHDPPYNGY